MKGKKIFRLIVAVLTVFTCFAGYVTTNSVSAESTVIKTSWSAATVGFGTEDSTDTDIKLKPNDGGSKAFNMGFEITIGQTYEVGQFSMSIPLDLMTYKDGTKCTLDVTKLPFPKAPEANDIGLSYEVVGNNLVLKNTKQLTTSGGKILFSLPWSVDTGKVADGTNVNITPTCPGATVNSCKLSYDTYARISASSKAAKDNIYAFPDLTKWYGQEASAYDFTNYYYKTYEIYTDIAGTQDGTLTVTDTPDGMKAGDKIVAMSTNPNDSEKPEETNKLINAQTGSMTISTTGGGRKTVYVLMAFKKDNYPLLNNSFTLPANDAKSHFVSKEDGEISDDTSHANATKFVMYVPPEGVAKGFGKSPYTTTNTEAGMLAAYKYEDVKLADWIVGSAIADANITRLPGENKHGFILADDYMYAQLQTGNPDDNAVVKLNQNDYYFGNVRVNAFDNSYDSDKKKVTKIDPASGNSTASAEVFVQTTTGGSWTKVGDLTYADMASNKELWNPTSATVMNSTITPQQVCGVKVVAKGFDYKSNWIKLTPTCYIKKNAPTINTLLTGNENGTIFFDNTAWVGLINQNGNEVRFDNYGDKQYGAYEDDEGNPVAAMSDADYQKAQQSTYGGILATAGPDGENRGDKQVMLNTDAAGAVSGNTNSKYHFRLNGCINANGIAGKTSSKKVQIDWQNDTSNQEAIIKYRTGGVQYYPMSKENTNTVMEKTGLKLTQKSGVIYDLLPMGVEFVSADKAYGISLTQTTADVKATVVDNNYMGTGRSLVKFELSNVKDASGTNPVENTYYPAGDTIEGSEVTSPSGYSGYDTRYLETGFTVDYTVKCNWKNIAIAKLTAAKKGSLIAYQDGSNVQFVGGDSISSNTQDDPSQNTGTSRNWLIAEGTTDAPTKWYMDDLSKGASTNAATVYNVYTEFPEVPTVNVVGLEKSVTSDMTNYTDETSVQVGSDYQYQITFGNGDSGEVDQIVLYDVLEDAQGSNKGWKGTFKSINNETLTAMNIKPVVYYSTYDGFDVDDKDFAYDLTDADQAWTTTEPTDKTTITAVAIDCSKKDDGTKFTLPQGASISAFIQMTAPTSKQVGDTVNTAEEKQSGKAYNRAAAAIHHSVGQFANETTIEINIEFATKVNLVDTNLPIKVVKNDDTPNTAIVAGAKYVIKATGMEDINCITDENGILKRLENDKKGTVATDDDEDVQTELRLPAGTYTLTETESPEGYELNETEYTITVTANLDGQGKPDGTYSYKITYLKDNVETELTKDNSSNYIVTDEMSRANLEIIKQQDTVDENGDADPTPLKDVGFTLYTDKACTTVYEDEDGNEVAEKVTGEDGKIDYENIPSGTYYLKETTVPRGIIDPSEENYDNTENTTIYEVVSNLGKITVTKIDTSLEDQSEVTTALDMTDVKDEDDNVIAQSTTLDNARIRRFVSGNVFVDKNENGEFESADERNVDDMKVALLDEGGNEVKDVDGNIVEPVTTDTDGNYKFENLPQGKYQVVGYYDYDAYLVTKVNTTTTDDSNLATLEKARSVSTDKFAVIKDIDTEDENIEHQNIGIIANVDKAKKEVLLNGVNVGTGTKDNPIKVKPGDKFTYIITVNNKATNTEDVIPAYTVVDDVPEGLTIDSIDPDSTGTINGQNVLWKDVELKTGENKFIINVTVDEFSTSSMSFVNIAYGARGDDIPEEESNPQYTEAVNPPKKVKTGDDTIINTSILTSIFALLIGVLTLVTRKKETE